jgi:transcriptional regulator with XRE-family HTH domain
MIGKVFKRLRMNKGRFQNWVAKQMGISGSQLSLMESGKRRWTMKREEQFLKAIGEK